MLLFHISIPTDRRYSQLSWAGGDRREVGNGANLSQVGVEFKFWLSLAIYILLDIILYKKNKHVFFNIPLKNKVKHVFFNKLNFRQHTTPPPQRRKMFCWHYVVSEVYQFQLVLLSSCCKHGQPQFQPQPQCLPACRVLYVFTYR